jgi:protease-4
MKHRKGLIIFVTILVLSLISGGHSFFTKLKNKTNFSFNLQTNDSYDEDFDEGFEDDYDFESNKNSFKKFLDFARNSDSDTKSKSLKNPYVAIINITGIISEENKTYNQKWLLHKIRNAKNDKNNRGILLKIDSPGGTVYESDEAYLALEDYKAATGRPIFAYFTSLAASGGYYIACASDYIYANRNCLTGSIGVIAGQSLDATVLLEKVGLKMTTITAGRNKNMGNYNSVLTEEQRSIMQSIADEAYEQFTGIVAESRKLELAKVKELADGRVYTANQAKNNGLIDSIRPFDEAKNDIKQFFLKRWNFEGTTNEESKDEAEDVSFIEYKYQYQDDWISLISGAASFIKNPEASVYELLGSTRGKCLYLYN